LPSASISAPSKHVSLRSKRRSSSCSNACTRIRPTPRGRRRVIHRERCRNVHAVGPVGASAGVNRAMRARAGRWSRRGRYRDPGQAPAVSPVSAPLAGRRPSAVPPAGDRSAPDHAGGDGVADTPVALPSVWGVDPRGAAAGGAPPSHQEALDPASRPSWRCARGRIACRSGRPRR
jgi:hypothetical protein